MDNFVDNFEVSEPHRVIRGYFLDFVQFRFAIFYRNPPGYIAPISLVSIV